jgi:hypothetical protein
VVPCEANFHAVDVFVRAREKERDVDAQRRNTGEAVILQHEHRAAERVVEAARHDVGLRDAALVHVHAGLRHEVIGDRDRRPLFDALAGDDRNLRGRIERLFRTRTAGRHDRLRQGGGGLRQREIRRLTGTNVGGRLALVAEQARGHGVAAVGQIDDPVATVGAGDRAIALTAGHLGAHADIFDRPTGAGIGHLAGNGATLGRQRRRRDGSRGDRNGGSGNNASEQQVHLTPREGGKNSEVRHTRDDSRVKVGFPSSRLPDGRAERVYVERVRKARQYAAPNRCANS